MTAINETRIRIPAKPQRRAARRRGVRVPCEVVADGYRLLGTEAVDLSEMGMLVRSDAEVTMGQRVDVSVKLPRGLSWVDVKGEVARVLEDRRAGDRGRMIGIRFRDVSPMSRGMLRGSLRSLPDTSPKRVPKEHRGAMILRVRE